MAIVLNVPWYATSFRSDQLEQALLEIAPVALRYRATDWAVYRYQDDQYKFQQMATFEDPADYSLYWNGPEFAAWRADYSGWYQVPVVYNPVRLVASGRLGGEPNGNGAAGNTFAHAD
jgi:hypothetical protein